MKIHELYSDKSKWTQGAFARDSDGMMVGSKSPNASCFCLSQAIMVCYPNSWDERDAVRCKIRKRIPIYSIANWNDHPDRTFEEVRDLCLELDI